MKKHAGVMLSVTPLIHRDPTGQFFRLGRMENSLPCAELHKAGATSKTEIKTDGGNKDRLTRKQRGGGHADLCYCHGARLSPDLYQLLLSKPVVPQQLRLDGRHLLLAVRHRTTRG